MNRVQTDETSDAVQTSHLTPDKILSKLLGLIGICGISSMPHEATEMQILTELNCLPADLRCGSRQPTTHGEIDDCRVLVLRPPLQVARPHTRYDRTL